MKKNVLISFASMAILLGFTSCNKDDETTPSNTNSIVGKWEWSKETTYDGTNTTTEDYKHFEECGKDYLLFEANGKVKDVYYENPNGIGCIDYDIEGLYSISGNTITVTEDDGETYSYNFSVTNDELRIVDTGNDGVVYTSILVRK